MSTPSIDFRERPLNRLTSSAAESAVVENGGLLVAPRIGVPVGAAN
jgi:hypothetical protein